MVIVLCKSILGVILLYVCGESFQFSFLFYRLIIDSNFCNFC